MSLHIALLRAVNVGGTGKLKMAELKAMAEAMGFTEVSTLLQSGNLAFRADKADRLEARIETELEKRFGLRSAVIVRTSDQWAKIVAANPYPDEARLDPSHLLVMPLKTPPKADAEAALQAAIKGPERVRVVGETAYFVYPEGMADTKLTPAIIERNLGAVGAARNWNTTMKLLGLVQAP
jgi:uncharacterized protein (DUF1697 family)